MMCLRKHIEGGNRVECVVVVNKLAQVAREAGSGSYYLQNACPTLLQRNALTGLRAARCQELTSR